MRAWKDRRLLVSASDGSVARVRYFTPNLQRPDGTSCGPRSDRFRRYRPGKPSVSQGTTYCMCREIIGIIQRCAHSALENSTKEVSRFQGFPQQKRKETSPETWSIGNYGAWCFTRFKLKSPARMVYYPVCIELKYHTTLFRHSRH